MMPPQTETWHVRWKVEQRRMETLGIEEGGGELTLLKTRTRMNGTISDELLRAWARVFRVVKRGRRIGPS